MALTEADYRQYPGLRNYHGVLRPTIEHNIEMERRYGIPPGANSAHPQYADPEEYWREEARGGRGRKGDKRYAMAA